MYIIHPNYFHRANIPFITHVSTYIKFNIIPSLRQLTRQGKTIVATIHQPSSIVFDMFDRILLMGEGRVAFFGTTDEAVHFFQEK